MLSGCGERDSEGYTQEEAEKDKKVQGEEKNAQQENEEAPAPKRQEVTDGQYEGLLSNGMPKEQFLFMLAHGPARMDEGDGLSMDDLSKLVFYMTQSGADTQLGLLRTDDTTVLDACGDYDLESVNALLSVLTDYRLKESDNGSYKFFKVAGQTVSVDKAEPITSYFAKILSAWVEGDEMGVRYEASFIKKDLDKIETFTQRRKATLRKGAQGSFRIVRIEPEETEETAGWKFQYGKILEHVREGNFLLKPHIPDNQRFGDGEDLCEYCIHDLDGDGIPELILRNINEGIGFWKVYSLQAEQDGYVVRNIPGEMQDGAASAGGSRISVKVPQDGAGLIVEEGASYTPMVNIYRLGIRDGRLEKNLVGEMDWQAPEYEAFFEGMGNLSWLSVEEASLLEAAAEGGE